MLLIKPYRHAEKVLDKIPFLSRNYGWMLPNLLIVDDEKNARDALEQLLSTEYEVFLAKNFDDASKLLKAEKFDIILSDLRMAGKDGLCVLEEALKRPYNPICIMMSAYGSVEVAVEAVKRGAYDFVTKPLDLERLELLMRNALANRKNQKKYRTGVVDQQNTSTSRVSITNFTPGMIIGNSRALLSALDEVRVVAPTLATVLLEGETGTGKELFANAIHYYSKRSDKPFVAVHCASLQKTLLESELFGHEKGAFTGADSRKIGLFEKANGGTIFFDEIGEIDLQTQVKLLRFLETKTFSRVGSTDIISVDVRTVCATNKNLYKMVTAGQFRDDLFYRLNVITLHLPPLRDRIGDIPLLLDHYSDIFSKENTTEKVVFLPDAMKVLCDYKWPGNIRELRNFCESSAIFHAGMAISENDLDRKFFCKELRK